EGQKTLYDRLKSDGLYSKDLNSFKSKYFSTSPNKLPPIPSVEEQMAEEPDTFVITGRDPKTNLPFGEFRPKERKPSESPSTYQWSTQEQPSPELSVGTTVNITKPTIPIEEYISKLKVQHQKRKEQIEGTFEIEEDEELLLNKAKIAYTNSSLINEGLFDMT